MTHISHRVLSIVLITAALITSPIATYAADAPATATTTAESPDHRDARMAWWRGARFGMFIHWGVYSVPAGTYDGKQVASIGEWIMNNASIPVAEYAKFPPQFDPVKFDADQWVSIAKAAGMKYMVITAKHHDGFAMFHSQASTFNIFDATPFKRDPIKELSESCAKHGIKFGVYYSQVQDWNHPGGVAIRRNNRTTDHWDKAQDGSFDDYLKTVAIPQVRELLTNYGPISVLWWDTPANITAAQASQLHDLLALQPDILSNNRLGGGFKGDTETPEQRIPARGFPGRDWETCMTINDTWGYKSYDTNFKTTERLLRNLIDIASKGGNYLLNVGPTAEGIIPEPEVQRLAEMGKWLDVNGDAIYGTSAGPFARQLAWGRATRKPGHLYLSVFNWPKDGKLTVPIGNSIDKAYLLAKPDEKLAVTTNERGIEISLPTDAPDPIATVIALDFAGEVDVVPPPSISQAGDGTLILTAADADILGNGSASVEGTNELNIGSWTSASSFIQWKANVDHPGTFAVSITYSCQPDRAGTEYTIAAGDQQVAGKIEATKSWTDYQVAKVGDIRIDQPGPVVVTIKITKAARGIMNLRKVTFVPTDTKPTAP